MKNLSLLLLLIATLSSCTKKAVNPDGIWKMTLALKETTLDFYIEVKGEKAQLFNADETIELMGTKKENTYTYPIGTFDAALTIDYDAKTATGKWEKFNRKEAYKVNLKGVRVQQLPFPDDVSELDTKYEMDLIGEKKTKKAILIFTSGYASVITPTGDYRYLRPSYTGTSLTLTGFDGIFAFKFDGILVGDTYDGTLYAGKDFKQKFSALSNISFELANPKQITTYKGKIDTIKLDTMAGVNQSLIKKGKVNIIQIFGSWCPNCIDETKFLQSWLNNNPDLGVEVSMVAFERSPNKQHAITQLKKSQNAYEIKYPIYLAGVTGDDKVDAVFKGMKNFASFPTTIYVDKKGLVRQIHSGFSGPATGMYYDTFTREFDQFVNKLLSE